MIPHPFGPRSRSSHATVQRGQFCRQTCESTTRCQADPIRCTQVLRKTVPANQCMLKFDGSNAGRARESFGGPLSGSGNVKPHPPRSGGGPRSRTPASGSIHCAAQRPLLPPRAKATLGFTPLQRPGTTTCPIRLFAPAAWGLATRSSAASRSRREISSMIRVGASVIVVSLAEQHGGKVRLVLEDAAHATWLPSKLDGTTPGGRSWSGRLCWRSSSGEKSMRRNSGRYWIRR